MTVPRRAALHGGVFLVLAAHVVTAMASEHLEDQDAVEVLIDVESERSKQRGGLLGESALVDAPPGREVPVTPQHPLGLVPQCEVPVSPEHPLGVADCETGQAPAKTGAALANAIKQQQAAVDEFAQQVQSLPPGLKKDAAVQKLKQMKTKVQEMETASQPPMPVSEVPATAAADEPAASGSDDPSAHPNPQLEAKKPPVAPTTMNADDPEENPNVPTDGAPSSGSPQQQSTSSPAPASGMEVSSDTEASSAADEDSTDSSSTEEPDLEKPVASSEPTTSGSSASSKPLPAKTTALYEYDATGQKACCASEPEDWNFLDINNDKKNGVMANLATCEAKCRGYKGCKYFEINPTADVDWCVGFPACDHQCVMKYNRPHTIFQLGDSPLETTTDPSKTSTQEPASSTQEPTTSNNVAQSVPQPTEIKSEFTLCGITMDMMQASNGPKYKAALAKALEKMLSLKSGAVAIPTIKGALNCGAEPPTTPEDAVMRLDFDSLLELHSGNTTTPRTAGGIQVFITANIGAGKLEKVTEVEENMRKVMADATFMTELEKQMTAEGVANPPTVVVKSFEKPEGVKPALAPLQPQKQPKGDGINIEDPRIEAATVASESPGSMNNSSASEAEVVVTPPTTERECPACCAGDSDGEKCTSDPICSQPVCNAQQDAPNSSSENSMPGNITGTSKAEVEVQKDEVNAEKEEAATMPDGPEKDKKEEEVKEKEKEIQREEEATPPSDNGKVPQPEVSPAEPSLPSPTPATAQEIEVQGFVKKHEGKKCAAIANPSETAGIDQNGHCEAGSGGSIKKCIECITSNPLCDSSVLSWQPDSDSHLCQCVTLNDPCLRHTVDENYEIWIGPKASINATDDAITSADDTQAPLANRTVDVLPPEDGKHAEIKAVVAGVLYKATTAGFVFSEGFPVGTQGADGVACVGANGCQFQTQQEAELFCSAVDTCKGVVQHPVNDPVANSTNPNCAKGLGCFTPGKGELMNSTNAAYKSWGKEGASEGGNGTAVDAQNPQAKVPWQFPSYKNPQSQEQKFFHGALTYEADGAFTCSSDFSASCNSEAAVDTLKCVVQDPASGGADAAEKGVKKCADMCQRCKDCKAFNFIRNAYNNAGGLCIFLSVDPSIAALEFHECKPWEGEGKCQEPGTDKDWYCCSEGFFYELESKAPENVTAQEKICECVNGEAGVGEACPQNGAISCAKCDTGFAKNSDGLCVANVCTCANGVAAMDEQCKVNNTALCASCNQGYSLSGDKIACTANKCACPNGQAATGETCPTDGAEVCTACNNGYQIAGGACVQKTAPTPPPTTLDEAPQQPQQQPPDS